ncbi:MAG: protein translocase subunit SecF [Candidatus Aenigmatarchaeota archaeon]
MDKIKKLRMSYKQLIAIPSILLLISSVIFILNFQQSGEWILRSIELKGGTLITLPLNESDASKIEGLGVDVRYIRSMTGTMAQLQIPSDVSRDNVMAKLAEMGIDTSSARAETIGPVLGEAFWVQTQTALAVALVCMAGVIYVLFRRGLPSLYVMLCAVSDIFVTLAFMQVFSIELSLATFAALLMLLGYSIDTDIVLTTKVLKGEGEVKDRVRSAFSTGITMSATTIAALLTMILLSLSPVISQIATVLLIGIFVDICFTWCQNAVLIRWWIEK